MGMYHGKSGTTWILNLCPQTIPKTLIFSSSKSKNVCIRVGKVYPPLKSESENHCTKAYVCASKAFWCVECSAHNSGSFEGNIFERNLEIHPKIQFGLFFLIWNILGSLVHQNAPLEPSYALVQWFKFFTFERGGPFFEPLYTCI